MNVFNQISLLVLTVNAVMHPWSFICSGALENAQCDDDMMIQNRAVGKRS